jgi:hypothetical protein
MLGFILWPALALGCFSLAMKGFSAQGIPLSKSTFITGLTAQIIGIICGMLGLGCLGLLGMMLIGHSMR